MLLILVLLLGLLFLIQLWWNNGPKYLPPGPINWLGIGGMLALHKADPHYPHAGFGKLAEKYGDILYLKLGVNKTVVFSRYEDIVELFTKDELSQRYEFGIGRDRSFNMKELGLLWSNNSGWREIRRFSQKKLRDVGFKKSEVLEKVISEEISDFMGVLKSEIEKGNGTSTVLRIEGTFTESVVNIIWNLVFGFQPKDCEDLLHRLLKINTSVAAAIAHGNINLAFPALKKIIPGLTGHSTNMKIFKESQDIIIRAIEESNSRRGGGDEESQSFVHAFQDQIEKENNSSSPYTDEQLIMVLLDIFLAGSETTSHFLSFALLHLIVRPDIQVKIQEEIQSVISETCKFPRYSDAPKMVYTQAFIYEIFRYCNIVPIPLPRVAAANFEYKGYTIPKGTCLMYNLHCVFNNKEYWGDPQVFRPERFIDENRKLRKTERVNVFGFGKRFCVGDTLSQQTAFKYLTSLLANFNFSRVSNEPSPSTTPESSFTSKPYPFNILISNRNEN